MSCFICDDAHITALAAYAVQHGLADVIRLPAAFRLENPKLTDAEVLALGLRSENVASFRACYAGRHESDITDFQFRPETARAVRAGAFAPIQMIKSAQCFEYQSCEHSAWKNSYVRLVIENIIAHAVGQLPGYDDAAWGAPVARKVAA